MPHYVTLCCGSAHAWRGYFQQHPHTHTHTHTRKYKQPSKQRHDVQCTTDRQWNPLSPPGIERVSLQYQSSNISHYPNRHHLVSMQSLCHPATKTASHRSCRIRYCRLQDSAFRQLVLLGALNLANSETVWQTFLVSRSSQVHP